MQRILLLSAAFLLAVGVLVVFAPSAQAHGGQFRGPGDSVPPGLREPSDPTPPPPPPPSGPPSSPTPVTPTPNTPPPSAPTTPTGGPPTTTGPTTGPNQRPRGPQTSFEDWTFWYHNNKDPIENLKKSIYSRLQSRNPLFQVGDDDSANRGAATRLTQRKVKELLIPTLLWTMDRKNAKTQDTESAAYIALAKVARDPVHIKTLESGLDLAKDRDQIVRESAALALGLLRRANPDDQFTARELDKVRNFLFDVFENDKYQTRTRGFAAVSIGILGDQPTGSGDYAGDREAAAKATTNRLFDLLAADYKNQDLYVALLVAIGLQPETSLDADQRGTLAAIAYRGRLRKRSFNELVRSNAAHTLGRIGTAKDRKILDNILTSRRNMPKNIQRSAAIGLGLLGRLVSGEDRVAVAKTLLGVLKRSRDPSTINFAIISLSQLLVDDIKSKSTDVIGNTQADEKLLELATKGSYMQKPFAALALGLVTREINDELEIDAYQKFKESALRVIREGVNNDSMEKKARAAFATAAGIARDSLSKEKLRQIVADRKGDKMLRSYACLGLGLLGEPSNEVMKTIADAMRERSSADLRRESAVALGLLGNRKIPGTGQTAVELLISELKHAKTQSDKGQVVLALASIGDDRAVQPLVDLVRNKKEQDLTRALACAGLGLIGDLEWMPSLSR
ncbi:MAG: HEAT repeat domain-containing protein, partial [Planctomycetota bacterium]